MGMLGSTIGSALGGAVGKHFGGHHGHAIGSAVGGAGGSLLPFRRGGRIRAPRGKPVPILAHGGEYILPVGVAPTMKQKREVAKKHKAHEKKEMKKMEMSEHKPRMAPRKRA